MNLKSYIPKPIKYFLIAIYVFWRCITRGSGAKNEIVVNLAGILPPPGSTQIIHGGKPKFLHIRERFGDSWKHFNIAYFGSSSIPFAPSIWIKIYKLFGVKIAWNQNGVAYPALYSKETADKINSLLKPIHLCDYVVYQTEFVKRCADKYLGEFKGPSSVIENPVDTEKFKPKERPITEKLEPLIIIMLGNHFESEERMRVSIEAIKKVREKIDAKLIIIGGIQYDINEEWIEKRGAYLQKDAPALFQSAHLFLHLKYLDPCPITVLEALASGLPVVGQANGGMPELVSNGSGILVPSPEDFDKLHYPRAEEVAEEIIKIYKGLDTYSRAARQNALKFDSRIWLDKHERIFKNLIAK